MNQAKNFTLGIAAWFSIGVSAGYFMPKSDDKKIDKWLRITQSYLVHNEVDEIVKATSNNKYYHREIEKVYLEWLDNTPVKPSDLKK